MKVELTRKFPKIFLNELPMWWMYLTCLLPHPLSDANQLPNDDDKSTFFQVICTRCIRQGQLNRILQFPRYLFGWIIESVRCESLSVNKVNRWIGGCIWSIRHPWCATAEVPHPPGRRKKKSRVTHDEPVHFSLEAIGTRYSVAVHYRHSVWLSDILYVYPIKINSPKAL